MIFGNTEEIVILVLNFGWKAERREDMGDDWEMCGEKTVLFKLHWVWILPTWLSFNTNVFLHRILNHIHLHGETTKSRKTRVQMHLVIFVNGVNNPYNVYAINDKLFLLNCDYSNWKVKKVGKENG